jgi:ubiquinone/menaquinone biosynthesis C-methylase UbiE
MDYDRTAIASTYDAARSYRPDMLQRSLDPVERHAPATLSLIADVGCGTGRFTFPLAERFQARVVGIDPSETMLAAARKKTTSGKVEFRRAPAERLPLDDGTVDIVFMSMMLHHLNDRVAAARESRRVLAPMGRVCVRNTTRDSLYPQARFFAGFQAIVETQLPSRDEVVALFEHAGLRLRAYELVPHTLAASWQELADKLVLRADSFLARLPDAEFEAGMRRLRAHVAQKGAGEEIIENIHFFVFERPENA